MKILITGTSRGIGLACAKKYIEMGHEVIGFDVTESKFTAPNYTHMIVDIAKELPNIEGVNVIINNAGIQEGPDVIDINLKATIKVTEKYAFQDAICSVLFMASSSASNGAEFPEYAASKGGVVTYMKNTALRLAKYGATSNSISAGGVYTPLNAHIMDDPNLMEQCLDETLLHRWASAEEIAEFSYFLTNVNKSMTGQDILVDNGEQLKSNFIW
ncbi:3-oxoacyl-[acyl-carrier protein] reductase [Butyrivibrio hungatei DSM 14810]|uniref:3-oxoacyl-[acyl-carrier protein] reductase n=1 Tax=Butyrivibrio hungatei DSM 14810 TaxID=1121132 RepID=A0A1M7SF83_9FIRM|nr:SDR family oxidoreductase [Butyrivibrio hungatei]SHN57119.1 3-oxoacyl-[acyl-carrier protein] reductase [Butyrivibrio hungatei DSM 14810]